MVSKSILVMGKEKTKEICTIYQTASFVGKRWTLLILLELHKGDNDWKRFSEIKNNMKDITAKVLAFRLKELISESLVKKRIDTSSYPIKSEYSLTLSGKDFISIIQDMKKWALKWNVKTKHCNDENCRHCEF